MNNIEMQKIDLKKTCGAYSGSIQRTLKDLFSITVDSKEGAQSITKLKENDNLYFSILFTGQVYGEFLIGLTKKTAIRMLGIAYIPENENEIYEKHRSEILGTFKEVANIAAGATLSSFKEVFNGISITPPRSIEGYITLSSYQIESVSLEHEFGELSCYIYVDYMRLDIANTLFRKEKLLYQEKEKQEELRRLNKAKSQFLANMSHELRTPLNGMIGMLDVLKTSSLDQTQLEQFDVIYRSGEFLLTLISDILEFSKIESGKLEIESRPFDLRETLETVADSLAPVIHRRNLNFIVKICPQISGQYIGDQTRIKQIFNNLIGNAAKFTPTGSISLLVDPEGEESIKFQVVDTGIGIPKGKVDSIFGSFNQADISDSRKYGGTGLGLSISKSIVHAMGGEIKVESEEAKGSCFTVTLPLKKQINGELALRCPELENTKAYLIMDDRILAEYVKDSLVKLEGSVDVAILDQFELDTTNTQDIVFLDFSVVADTEQADLFLSSPLWNQMVKTSTRLIVLVQSRFLAEGSRFVARCGGDRIGLLNVPLSLGKLITVISKSPTKVVPWLQKIRPSSATQIEPNGTIRNRDNKKILVVEDNPTNQLVIKTLLQKMGYQCQIVNDGQEALNLFSTGQVFDLVFMDCQMPIMNGYQATKAIRALEQTKGAHTPIIALTANAFRETKEECFEAGMDDFATKPLRREVLENILVKVFKARSVGN